MKTILIGYENTHGLSGGKVLDVPQDDQVKLFDDAKKFHKFPKGIKRFDLCRVEVASSAVFISEDVAKQAEDIETRKQKAAEELEASRKKAGDEAAKKARAIKEYQTAALKRNEANARVRSLENNLNQARASGSNDSVKEYESLLKSARAAQETTEKAFEAAKAAKESHEPKTETKK